MQCVIEHMILKVFGCQESLETVEAPHLEFPGNAGIVKWET